MALDFSKSGANKIIKEVAKDNDSLLNTSVIANIDISLINKNEDNEKVFNMNDIDVLAKAIERDGFSGGVEVLKLDDGTYELISGHRRFEAVKKLGWDTIPCIIIKNLDEITKAKKLLASNIYNRKMTPMDWARAVEYYKDKVLTPQGIKAKREECLKFFNIKMTTLYRYEAMLKLIPELQKFMEIPEFPYVPFMDEKVAQMDREMQYKIYEGIKPIVESSSDQISGKAIKAKIQTIVEFSKRKPKEVEINQPTEPHDTIPLTSSPVIHEGDMKSLAEVGINNIDSPMLPVIELSAMEPKIEINAGDDLKRVIPILKLASTRKIDHDTIKPIVDEIKELLKKFE